MTAVPTATLTVEHDVYCLVVGFRCTCPVLKAAGKYDVILSDCFHRCSLFVTKAIVQQLIIPVWKHYIMLSVFSVGTHLFGSTMDVTKVFYTKV